MKYFLIILLICASSVLFADEFPIRQAHLLAGSQLSYECPDYSQMLFFADAPHGHRDIFAQKINQDGATLWDSPIPVIDNDGDQRLLGGVKASDGNFILLWLEYALDITYEMRLQKISPTGQRLWQTQGVGLGSGMFVYDKAILVPNSSGGAYVIYTDASFPNTVYGQNYDAGGIPQWEPDTELHTSASELELRNAVSDGAGGVMVNILKFVTSYPRSHLLRFNAAAEPVGSQPLVNSNLFPGDQFDLMSGIPGQFILWHHYEGEASIRFRKIDNQGYLLPTQWINYSLGSMVYMSDLKLAATADGGLVLAWSWADLSFNTHLRVQKFATNMTTQWPEADISTLVGQADIFGINLASNAGGYTWLSFTTWLAASGYQPSAHLINADGALLWGPGGITLGNGGYISNIIPAADRGIFLWSDREDGNSILKRQVVSTAGNQLLPEANTPFAQRIFGTANLKQSIALQDSYLLIWDDTREGGMSVYYQLLDAGHNCLLEPSGRALSPGFVKSVRKVGNNSAAVLYHVWVEGYRYYYVQLINSAGDPVYPGNGIPLTISEDGWPMDLRMSSYGDDIYLVWQQYALNTYAPIIMGQRISNGQKMWSENGRMLVTYPHNLSVQNYGFTGPYLLWKFEDYNQNQISCKVLMLDPNGDPMPGWAPGGLDIVSEIPNIYYQGIVHCGISGDDLVAYIETSFAGLPVVRAQRVSPQGQRLWQDTGIQIASLDQPLFFQDAQYGSQLAVLLRESGIPTTKLIFQGISPSGDLMHPGLGIEVASGLNSPQNALLSSYADGSWLCAWTDDDGELVQNRDIYIRHLTPDGTPLGTAPDWFCSARYSQYDLFAASLGNQALLAWSDDRTGVVDSEIIYTGVWGRAVSSAWSSLPDEQLPALSFSLGANYPNPFNPSTSIPFTLAKSGTASIEIYNLRGQLLRVLLPNSVIPAGTHSVVWNGLDARGKPVASGIYLCRMSFGGKTLSRKMLLCK